MKDAARLPLKGREILLSILSPFVLLDLSFIHSVSIYRVPMSPGKGTKVRESEWFLGDAESPIGLDQRVQGKAVEKTGKVGRD